MSKEKWAFHELIDIMYRSSDASTPFWLIRKCVGYIVKDLSCDELENVACLFRDRYVRGQEDACAAIGKHELAKRIMMLSEIVARAKNMVVNDTI